MIRDVLTKILIHVIFSGIAMYSANFEHYTWIDIFVFGLWMVLRVYKLEKYAFWFVQCIQFQVIVSVMIMSFRDCVVFEDAFRENGYLKYIPGNTAMHYFGMVAIYGLSSRGSIFPGAKSVLSQCAGAYGVNAVWHHFEDPMVTYGCSLPSALGSSGVLIISVLFAIFGVYVQQYKPRI
jgi:hypothetical protein